MRGKHLLEFIKSEEKQKVMRALKRMLLEEVNLDIDVNLISKYENEIPYRLNCSLIREDNKITGVLGTGTNLSEINNFREKYLEISNRLTESLRLIEIEKSRI